MSRTTPTGTIRDGTGWVVVIWGRNPITGQGSSELMIRTSTRMQALVWVRENNYPQASFGDRIDLILRQPDLDRARANDGQFLWRPWPYDGEWNSWPSTKGG